MPIPQEALDLENLSLGSEGKPTLADAYRILEKQWIDGDRDRELGLHLMFLSWYGIIEPEHISGFPETAAVQSELNRMLKTVHTFFEPQIHHDAEMLYAVGLAAHMFWFMFDDSANWKRISVEYRARYRVLAPTGIAPATFHGRGAYGAYYSEQATITDGY